MPHSRQGGGANEAVPSVHGGDVLLRGARQSGLAGAQELVQRAPLARVEEEDDDDDNDDDDDEDDDGGGGDVDDDDDDD